MNNMPRIVIIGSGNLAESLALALCQKECGLIQLYGRNRLRAQAIGALCGIATASEPQELAEADLYLVAVSDRAIRQAVESLPIPPNALVAHTAGSVSIDELPFEHRGSFYPFQSFTRGRRVDFAEIPLFLEAAHAADLELLEAVGARICRNHYRANAEQRRLIHLAGVFACNFVNALYGVGSEILQRGSLPFEILKPLIMETARKACESDAPATVQTGPAVRGDKAVEQAHCSLLGDEESLKRIYTEISKIIWETSKKRLQTPKP